LNRKETVVVNEKTGASKASKLARYDLVPWEALDKIAEVYGMGAQKYADRNWEKGYDWGLSLAALVRHVSLFAQGEDLDEESGLPHLAHAGWHCMALLTFMDHHRDLDNRSQLGKEEE
jgi:hypothetical protein